MRGVEKPSLKFANTGKKIETFVWLTPKQQLKWNRFAQESKNRLQHSSELALVRAAAHVSKQLLFGKTNWIRSNVKFVKERLVQSGDTETITTRFISVHIQEMQ